MKSLGSVEVDTVSKAEWATLMQKFDDASIYQTWSYSAIRWGQANSSHIIIKENDEVIAAAQLRIIRIPFLKVETAYLPWGPVWRRQSKEINMMYSRKY